MAHLSGTPPTVRPPFNGRLEALGGRGGVVAASDGPGDGWAVGFCGLLMPG